MKLLFQLFTARIGLFGVTCLGCLFFRKRFSLVHVLSHPQSLAIYNFDPFHAVLWLVDGGRFGIKKRIEDNLEFRDILAKVVTTPWDVENIDFVDHYHSILLQNASVYVSAAHAQGPFVWNDGSTLCCRNSVLCSCCKYDLYLFRYNI